MATDISKGRIGDDACNLLGSLVVTALQQAAMSRAPRSSRGVTKLRVPDGSAILGNCLKIRVDNACQRLENALQPQAYHNRGEFDAQRQSLEAN